MKNLPWGKILGVASRVAMAVVMGIPTTEERARKIGAASGPLKKDAVLDLVQTELQLAQLVTGRDLSQDGDVMKAAGVVVDAVVALHNLIARKARILPDAEPPAPKPA